MSVLTQLEKVDSLEFPVRKALANPDTSVQYTSCYLDETGHTNEGPSPAGIMKGVNDFLSQHEKGFLWGKKGY